MAYPPSRSGSSRARTGARSGALDAPLFPPAGGLGDDAARLVADSTAGDNAPPLSVSEISQALKRVVEDRFGRVRVRGELSGVKRAASGHLYCALKDDAALIDGVMWKGSAQRLAFRPEDGVEVIATGRLTTYPGRSKYQLVIDSMEVAGEGALLAMLERLRQRLAAEGLFDPARKVALPPLPRIIGVVTSPTGAVIRDIWHRLEDRFPTRVLLWPVIVQGEGAAARIAAAVAGFDALPADGSGPLPRPDLVIVARGGGSIEDLWAFNEEAVVRAIAACRIPIISAVGHETDTTLADHAADVRAPTPTAAAELAVPVRAELLAQVGDLAGRLLRARSRQGDRLRERLAAMARLLPQPDRLHDAQRQRLDDHAARLEQAGRRLRRDPRQALDRIGGRLDRDLLRAGLSRRRSALGLLARPLAVPAARLTAGRRDRLAELSRPLALDGARWAGPRRDRLTRLAAQAAAAAPRRARAARDRFTLRADALTPMLGARASAAARQRLDATGRLMDGLDPRRLLRVGYAMVLDGAGHVVTDVAGARAAGAVRLQFADGSVDAAVMGPDGPPSRPGTGAAAPRAAPRKPGQGDLFPA